MMKRIGIALSMAAIGVVGVSCEPPNASSKTDWEPESQVTEVLAEGVLFSVEYEQGDGKVGGITRVNIPEAVPGGNGSWNVNAYGRLTKEFLFITYPDNAELGPNIIPAHRIINVQFGDGGIAKVHDGSVVEEGENADE